MTSHSQIFEEIIQESSSLLRDVTTSNDRASAITAAAVLDDLLDLLLRVRMLKDDKIVGEFLDSNTFSFSVRIDLCYSLGLISKLERRDLHLVRKIRNDFAHSRKPSCFEVVPTRDHCQSLNLAKRFWAGSHGQPADMKTWFLSGWVILANQLSQRINFTQHADTVGEMNSNVEIVFGRGSPPAV